MASADFRNSPAFPARPISQELGQRLDQAAQEKGLTRRQLLYILGGGAAVVSVAGVAGGVALSNSGNNSIGSAAASVLNPGESESPKTPVVNKTENPVANETNNPAEFYDNYEVSADGNVVYLDPVGGKSGVRGDNLRGTHSYIDHKVMEDRVAEWQKIFDQPKMRDIIKSWEEVTSTNSAKTRDPVVEYFLYSNNANLESPSDFPVEGIRSKDRTVTLILRTLQDLKDGQKVPQKYLDNCLMLVRGSTGTSDNPFGITQSKLLPNDPEKLKEIMKYWENLDYGAALAKK